jgi:hypothetical protein
MARLVLRDDVGAELASLNVELLQAGSAWSTPTPRPVVVEGQSGLTAQSDRMYVNCPGLSIPNNIQRITVIGGIALPTQMRGWRDVWIGGTAASPMNAGPRTDGGDLCQIKRYPVSTGTIPEDVTIAYVHFHDISRPSGGSQHPDCIQLMSGRRITFGGCLLERTGEAVQPLFLRDAGGTAGGGPIEDVLIDLCTFRDVTHFYSIRIAGNDEVGSSGRYVPTRVTIRNCDRGGKNAAVDSAVQGLVWEGNVNGLLVRP